MQAMPARTLYLQVEPKGLHENFNLDFNLKMFYLLNGFFFDTRFAQSANFFPDFLKLERSANERKAIISSMTSSGKSRIDFLTKWSITDLNMAMSNLNPH